MVKKATTLESKLIELEDIISQLENGNLKLEEMITLYERGSILCKECKKKIDVVENKIKIIQNGN